MRERSRTPGGDLLTEPYGPVGELITAARHALSYSLSDAARAIKRAGLAQGARDATCSASTVFKWTHNGVKPQPRHRPWIAEGLDIPRDQLDQAIEALAELLKRSRPPVLTKDRAAVAGTFALMSVRTSDRPPTLDAEIAMSAEESARFVRRAGMRVDADVLDQIGAEIAFLARQYLGRPPHALFKPIAQLRQDVFALLDTHQPPHHATRLYFQAGQLCSLLAHLTTDLDHAQVAETHARTAWLCADLCNHHGLRAYIRWVQAQVAYWNGRYRTAAEIARSATDRASMLRVTSQEARAWAAAGEAGEAERTLDARAAAGDLDESLDLVGVFRFPPAKAAYYASEVLLALGGEHNVRRAMSAAVESLSLLADGADDDSCPEFVAAAHLDLVLAHLALSSLDGAMEQLRPVLEMPADHRTLQVIGRITKVAAALTRYASEPSAAEMRERIQLFAAHPAARQLAAITDHSEEA